MEFTYTEGATPLDPDDQADLIPVHITSMNQLNEWEQANILRAETWAFVRKKTNILNEGLIKELHRRMFNDTWRWAGEYRQSGKNIGIPWYQIPVRVINVCRDAEYWLRERSFSLDEIGVRVHHRLVSVHPFANGNGRHARLFTDMLLFQADAPRFSWGRANLPLPGSARATYLDALREADGNNYDPLLTFARS